MPRLAANLTMMFNEVPFEERFDAAARAGFRAVEFLFPYERPSEQLARWMANAGVENVLFNLPPGDWNLGERGLAALPGREVEFREGFHRALDYAQALGTPRLHVMAGLVPSGSDAGTRERMRSTYLENLRWAAEEALQANRTILIEPINPRDIPGYWLNHQQDALDVIAQVGASNLRLQFDLYHAQIVDGDLTRRIERQVGVTGHVQIAGVPDRHEPDFGELSITHLLATLDRVGYTGWVGCEYRPRGHTEAGLGWIAAAAPAARF
jgi:hydroxypyruvate isomerase